MYWYTIFLEIHAGGDQLLYIKIHQNCSLSENLYKLVPKNELKLHLNFILVVYLLRIILKGKERKIKHTKSIKEKYFKIKLNMLYVCD